MHIAYLADGHNYHVKKWIRALSDAGMNVTLITFRPLDEDIPNVTVIPLPIRFKAGKKNSVGYSYFNYYWVIGRVKSILKQIHPDLLLGSYATHYGWLAARTSYHPFVLQTWTFDLTMYPFKGYKRSVFGPIVRYSLSRADLITTDGPALYDEALGLYPKLADKFVPIRWGIRLTEPTAAEGSIPDFRTEHSIPDTSVVVTSPRGLLPVYRPESVLPELLRVLESDETVWVVVLTLAHERSDKAQEYLDRLDQHERAIVVDRFLTTDEMRAVWQSTDIVVSMPQADGISESLFESMHANAYPVMSDIPSNQSLLRDGVQGTIVPDPVSEHLASTLSRLITGKTRDASTELDSARKSNRAWVEENANVKKTAAEVRRHFELLIASR